MDKSFWDSIFAKGREYRKVNGALLDIVLAGLFGEGHPDVCLDVGCGTGDLVVKLAQRGCVVVGADISSVALEKAEAFVRGKGFFEKIKLIRFDADKDDYATLPLQPFDLITCKDAIAFVDDREHFFASLRKVLKEDGHLVIITSIRRKGVAYDERERAISVDPQELIDAARKSFPSFSMLREDFCEENLSTGVFVL